MTRHLLTAAEIGGLQSTQLYTREYSGTPFSVKGLSNPEDKPGHWATSIVSIHRDGIVLGGYRRLYSSYGADTFAPFQWEGVWYALYSANYTCTRVLRIGEDSIEDWCGEEPETGGFCPVEYYAPQAFMDYPDEADSGWTFDNASEYHDFSIFQKDAVQQKSPVRFPGFAFLAGCVWGDDSEWKLRYIDYSGVAGRQLVVDERFGYHELPHRALRECVDLQNWMPDRPVVHADKRCAFLTSRPTPGAN
jgi:hypothetical protein